MELNGKIKRVQEGSLLFEFDVKIRENLLQK
jgi:hypothetical protein